MRTFFHLHRAERQLILHGLVALSRERPDLRHALGVIADKIEGHAAFEELKRLKSNNDGPTEGEPT